jgi:hypothetical protein
MTIVKARRFTSYGLSSILWAGLVIWLAGCATSAPPPPRAAVSAAEATLAAAGRVILSCYAVPACAAAAPKATIRKDYDAAYTALTSAQAVADAGGSPDMTAATAALSLLQADVSTLPTPTKPS